MSTIDAPAFLSPVSFRRWCRSKIPRVRKFKSTQCINLQHNLILPIYFCLGESCIIYSYALPYPCLYPPHSLLFGPVLARPAKHWALSAYIMGWARQFLQLQSPCTEILYILTSTSNELIKSLTQKATATAFTHNRWDKNKFWFQFWNIVNLF